ncbi:MAG: transglutaminase-like domain-containing protein [Bacteroidota bacterium]
MKESEIGALIRLLDDPDTSISDHIYAKLLELGTVSTPYLENAWETSKNSVFQKKIEQLIHQIQFQSTSNNLKTWIKEESINLLKGMTVIAQYHYPSIHIEDIEKKIDLIAHDVWLEISEDLTPLEKVKVLNHIIYDIHGFEANAINFHAPENSFLNIVLDSKKGNPLTLSVIYSLVAQKVFIPIFGINLPEHFILGYKNTKENITFLDENLILFYINAFNKGSVFTRKEIELFIKELKIESKEYYYSPCTNIDIVKRLLNNLMLSFKNQADYIRENEIKALIELFD